MNEVGEGVLLVSSSARLQCIEILQSLLQQLMMNQTHSELKKALISFARRLKFLKSDLLSLTYDKCCELSKMVEEVFGKDCDVLLDRYHFGQRIKSTIVGGNNNSHYSDISKELHESIVKTARTPIKPAICWPKEEQERRMIALRDKYTKIGNVWKPDKAESVFNSQMVHIKRGCLSPNGGQKLKNDESRVESAHKTIASIQKGFAGGIVTMHHQLHDVIHRKNTRAALKAGTKSEQYAFSQSTYGSPHHLLVDHVNQLHNLVQDRSSGESLLLPRFQSSGSKEHFGIVETT